MPHAGIPAVSVAGGSAACLFTSVTWFAFAITIGVAVVAARRTLTPPY
jgi:hypothetical protein